MATKNDVTGDALVSKTTTESYRDGWDRIFGTTEEEEQKKTEEETEDE